MERMRAERSSAIACGIIAEDAMFAVPQPRFQTCIYIVLSLVCSVDLCRWSSVNFYLMVEIISRASRMGTSDLSIPFHMFRTSSKIQSLFFFGTVGNKPSVPKNFIVFTKLLPLPPQVITHLLCQAYFEHWEAEKIEPAAAAEMQ